MASFFILLTVQRPWAYYGCLSEAAVLVNNVQSFSSWHVIDVGAVEKSHFCISRRRLDRRN